MSDKKKKAIIITICGIIGAVVVLLAIALIATLFTHNFLTSMRNKAVYIIWVIVLVGIVSFTVIDVRMRGSKRVLKVNVDLENSHFMTKKEMSKNDGFTVTKLSELSNVNDGVPIYAKRVKDDIEIVLKDPIHTLGIGATGTGKTTSFVSPTIEILSRTKTKPSMVITDPKGELYIKHANSLEKQGYKVEVIDLADVYHSTQWNPFNDIWKKTEAMTEEVEQKMGKYVYGGITYLTNEEAEQAKKERRIRLKDEIYIDLQDLMYTACPVENKQDATWQRGARDLLFALALGFWEDVRDGYMDKSQFNLYNLYRNVTDYAKGEEGEAKTLKAYFNTREKTSRARGLSNTVLVTEDRTLYSFLGDVNQYLNWMADGGIATLTSGNDIEFSEFDEAPTVLFLKIPDEKENRHKLVSLLITQMYKALVEKATRNQELGRTDTQRLLRHIYFIMDEFGNLPKLYKMDSIVTVGRSRGIFMMPIIQGFKQLDDKYGKDVASTIRSNCNIQIFIGTNEEETIKIFSEQCGKKKVKQVSYSENRDMSVSTSAQSVPLIYPSQLERLNDPKNGISGNSIITCLGCYPIEGKTTPIYEVKDLYGMTDCPEKKKAFIEFDENKCHYDIVKITKFLEMERAFEDADREEQAQRELAQQVEQVEQAQQVEQVQQVDERQELIEREKERIATEILEQIKSRLSALKDKLEAGELDLLNSIGIRDKIYTLDAFAERSANAGNFLLSSEIENIKSFILFRCYEDDEIEEIEIECEKRRGVLVS